ncbi:MAG: LysM peptidoglycan-binding domain-containing protein [Sedimentisphaerales bacterium]|nr:LysM peptidoglycan-binding domain-containing protein [Sedimentisphaerales bacterium]
MKCIWEITVHIKTIITLPRNYVVVIFILGLTFSVLAGVTGTFRNVSFLATDGGRKFIAAGGSGILKNDKNEVIAEGDLKNVDEFLTIKGRKDASFVYNPKTNAFSPDTFSKEAMKEFASIKLGEGNLWTLNDANFLFVLEIPILNQPQIVPALDKSLARASLITLPKGSFTLWGYLVTVEKDKGTVKVAHGNIVEASNATIKRDRKTAMASAGLQVEKGVGAQDARQQVANSTINGTESPVVESNYIVEPADTLFFIAEKIYGDASRWKQIYEANRNLLSGPLDLRVGMKLKIPKASIDKQITNSGIALDSASLANDEKGEEKKTAPERKAWEEVDSLSKQSLEDFLEKFPDGELAEQAEVAVELQDKLSSIREGKFKDSFTISLELLGERWKNWQKLNPNKGVVGYYVKKGEKFNTLGWFSPSPLSGGRTPGRGTISFDNPGILTSPTGDGSLIAFRTGGLKFELFNRIVFETPGDEPMYFAVIEGKGLVHIYGEGKVTTPDGKETVLCGILDVTKEEVDDSNARRIKLSVRGEQIYVGEVPFMLSSYNSSGETAGMGFISLSADLMNTILDISELPEKYDPWSPKLGVQIGGGQKIVGIASLRRKMCRSAFINSNGAVFPDSIRRIARGGPFVALWFSSPNDNQISLQDLKIEASSKTQESFKMRQVEGDIVILEKVPREAISLRITSRYADVNQEWTGTLFPAFRSATPGIVLYSVKNVNVGREKSKIDPNLPAPVLCTLECLG